MQQPRVQFPMVTGVKTELHVLRKGQLMGVPSLNDLAEDGTLNKTNQPKECFFYIKGHVALDINPGRIYDTLLLQLISGDLLSAYPHRQFLTLPGILDSRSALSNSYPNANVPSREAVCIIFMILV